MATVGSAVAIEIEGGKLADLLAGKSDGFRQRNEEIREKMPLGVLGAICFLSRFGHLLMVTRNARS